jgi:hypothetical protein
MTVAVVDLDALRLSGWREDLRAQGDWHVYHAAAINDPPDLRLCLLVQGLFRSAVEIVLVTDQPSGWMIRCQEWLARHDIPGDLLMMRKPNDFRPSHEVKAEMIQVGPQERLMGEPAFILSEDIRFLDAARAVLPNLMTLEVTR